MSASVTGLGSAQELRRELSERNQCYAREHRLPHCLSYGEVQTVCFEPYLAEQGVPRHGNFLPATYDAILADPEWRKRLTKCHTTARRSLPNNGRRWMELDSSNSSDALLMNVFCYPRVLRDGRVLRLLGVDDAASNAAVRPEFGVKARVPLGDGKVDRTEVDMRIGDLLVEAKLTESDFQTKSASVVERYRDLDEVFDRGMLPTRIPLSFSPVHCDDHSIDASDTVFAAQGVATWRQSREREYLSYQLIRNVLAAHALQATFCVICDARRADLTEAWYAVMRAVRTASLRTRCKVITWQELARALPPRLETFLAEKYGIAAGTAVTLAQIPRR